MAVSSENILITIIGLIGAWWTGRKLNILGQKKASADIFSNMQTSYNIWAVELQKRYDELKSLNDQMQVEIKEMARLLNEMKLNISNLTYQNELSQIDGLQWKTKFDILTVTHDALLIENEKMKNDGSDKKLGNHR